MYRPGGRGGVAPRLSEVEPVAAVRVVEVVVGAAVWVVRKGRRSRRGAME
jgi:hypothetical protein